MEAESGTQGRNLEVGTSSCGLRSLLSRAIPVPGSHRTHSRLHRQLLLTIIAECLLATLSLEGCGTGHVLLPTADYADLTPG
ncbi:hypothetical protein LEMLEM_LOCUS15245 [Lemmus lemmus]